MDVLEIEENYIRRNRLRKASKEKYVAEMRAALPVYTLDDIRQYRLPYHEALLISLNERGFICSLEFVKQLLEYQEVIRNKAGVQSLIWLRPELKNSRSELKLLIDGLVTSERYHNAERYAGQCTEFLKLAVYFAFLNSDWWWLGEQLLIQSVSVCAEYTFLGGKYEALSRFCYAKFLIENVKDYVTATEQLQIVQELSVGTKWTTQLVFPRQNDLLFVAASFLLYVCFMSEAQHLIKMGKSEVACELASQARKKAAEACFLDGEINALILKGKCEMNLKDAKSAISSFNKASLIQVKLGSAVGMCEIRIQLAKAYLMNGNTRASLETLMQLKESATKHNLPYYLAQAYWQLGEFYLNNGQAYKATPLLAEALTLFHQGENVKESEQVRVLKAISVGLEQFPKFLVILSRTDQPATGLINLMKMVDWKDSRKDFWDEESSSFDDETSECLPISEEDKEQIVEEESVVAEEAHVYDDKAIIEIHFDVYNYNVKESSSRLLDIEQHLEVHEEKLL